MRLAFGFAVILFMQSSFLYTANAQCKNDLDCGGDLTCQNGTCAAPPEKFGSDRPAVVIGEGQGQPEKEPLSRAVQESSQASSSTGGNPCAQISCSGHGNCIVKNNTPVCACHDGYQPDGITGVNCIPVTVEKVPSSTNHYSTNTSDGDYHLGRADLELIEAALPEYCHDRDFLRYRQLVRGNRFAGTFFDFKIMQVKRRKPGAVTLLTFGSILAVASIPLIVVGFTVWGVPETSYSYYPTTGETVEHQDHRFHADGWLGVGSGLACIAAAIPFFITGVIRLTRTKQVLKTLKAITPPPTISASRTGLGFTW